MRTLMFTALVLAACTTPSGPVEAKSELGQTGALSPLALRIRGDLARLDRELRAPGVVAAALGESADLGNGLIVRPLSVVEDSRCPGDVTCIWAGRLRIRADVLGDDIELTLGQPTQTPHGAVLFAIAKPSPWASWPSELGPRPPYRFGFRRD